MTNLQKGKESNSYLCSMSFSMQGGRIRGFRGESKGEGLNFQFSNLILLPDSHSFWGTDTPPQLFVPVGDCHVIQNLNTEWG